MAAPILFSFRLPVCNVRPIYIYIYISDERCFVNRENMFSCNFFDFLFLR